MHKAIEYESDGRATDDEFFRALTFPEEDRHKVTSMPYQGGYRWFRSPNVIPIEGYRGRGKSYPPQTGTPTPGKAA
jgi:hypothetical protein